MTSKREILYWLESAPSSARYIAAAKRLDELNEDTGERIKIALLRNITLEPLLPYLKVACHANGLIPDIYFGGFDNIHEVAFDNDSALFEFAPDIIVIALRLHALAPQLIFNFPGLSTADRSEECMEALRRVRELVNGIRQRSSALLLVHNFESPLFPAFGVLDLHLADGQCKMINALNMNLSNVIDAIGGAFVIDLDRFILRLGFQQAIDNRLWHFGRAPYRSALLKLISDYYIRFASAIKGKNRKCLVLDCDNTLWGGVVGEVGLNGIELGMASPGSAFREFQWAILDLYNRGILLALNSKNNEADVFEVLDNHPDCLLKRNHFVSCRINWMDKAANLRSIAQELNIGLDSIVFVDDNAAEVEFVRDALPEVQVVLLPEDPTEYRFVLQSMGSFDTLAVTEEDRRRSEMYRKQTKRREMAASSVTPEAFLRGLQMVVTIGAANALSIPRVAQLTQKTNQFNLTTRRYSQEDIARMTLDAGIDVVCLSLKDRLDENGVVCVAIVRYELAVALIDTMLMSCRVIGKGVEKAMIAHIIDAASGRNCRRLKGEYIPSSKNAIVAEFFKEMGFEAESEKQGMWSLDLADAKFRAPDWLNIINTNNK